MRLERILAKLEKEMEQGAVCCLQEVNNLPFSSFSLSLSLTHTLAPSFSLSLCQMLIRSYPFGEPALPRAGFVARIRLVNFQNSRSTFIIVGAPVRQREEALLARPSLVPAPAL